MISAISNNTSQISSTGNAVQRAEKPSQLPVGTPPEDQVNLSPEAKRLAAAKAVSNNPVAVAAVSDNSEVDKLATTVYSAQQTQALVDTYQASSSQANNSNASASNDPQRSPIAIAAVSQNPQADELASTVYVARQAQQALETYRNASNSAQEQQQQASSVNEVI